jgi:NDP-sugar pyrophosphorylase family protein
MKIIIPMSGLGKRFLDAGYEKPKPLIKVNGKRIIEHVTSMFEGNHDFIFICNKEHLDTTDMWSILKSLNPENKIISIPQHNQGPVFSITHIFDHIGDEEDVLISYCDYCMEWDFKSFQEKIKTEQFAGAVPAYTGFHPHLLRRELYAGILVDNGIMKDIREKYSFTFNPEESHHSPGVYYFSRGDTFKKYVGELLNSNLRHDGEAYVSMLYYFYLRDDHKIYVPEVKKFIQWGTPIDLEEFEGWSRYFYNRLGKEKPYTYIQANREHLAKIHHAEDSKEFKDSYTYWEEYFKGAKID